MRSVWVGRRAVAILASLMWLVGSVVPSAHVHFTMSSSGQLEPVETHQHLQPHRLALAGHAAFHAADDHHAPAVDDDDDGLLTQNLEQQSSLRDSAVQLPILITCSIAISFETPPEPSARPHSASALVFPADPPLSPHGLRAPPVAT